MGIFPRPREKDLRDFYDHGKSNKLWHDIMMETYDNRKKNYIKNILPLLKNVMGGLNSLVDVGCGEGIWLDAIHTKFPDINLFGIEPFSTKKPEHYTLIKEFMESYSGVRKFDACTLLSVIEHVADPIKTLQSCKNLLNDGGILFLIAPNIAGFDYAALPIEKRNWEAPQHINYFTLESLKGVVKMCGFEIMEAGTFGVLDVEIVAKAVKEGASTNNEFLDALLIDKSTDENRKQLQKFISKNNMSGQTFIIGKLK
jgi:2-polyprenyl-3-methyl-5-hydroxy-6-metoxy-1,4-benzoquinol methylase